MIGYYLTLGLARVFSLLPLPVLYRFSDFISFLMGHILAYRKEVIDENLRKSFPEKTDQERNKIKREFYRNFADILVESIKSLSLTEKEIRERFTLANPEVFESIYRNNKGVIMVMGHYTNFEWTAMSIPLLVPQKCFAVYHPLKNQRFNRLVVKIREQFGLQLFSMDDTYPFMLNNPVDQPLYVFMADQSPHRGKIKYRTSFLNQSTPVHLGVENLARKCDLAVVFIITERTRRGHYQVKAELLYEDVKNTSQYEVTNTHVKSLEKAIKQSPASWLWSHKRWKHA